MDNTLAAKDISTINDSIIMENLVAKDIHTLDDRLVDDKITVKSYTTDKVEETDTSFGVWYPEDQTNCPLILFAHGYGGSSQSHAPLAAELAAKGYVVVIPDREGDDAHGFWGIFTFMMFATPLNTVTVDGTTLKLALEYVKKASQSENSPLSGGKVDTTRIISGGFSMGGVEAIHFAASQQEDEAPDVRALLLVSPSIMRFGTISWRISHTGLIETSKNLTCPTLLVTSDNDMAAVGAFSYHESVFQKSTLVNVKTSSLDVDCPNTRKSSWNQFLTAPGKYMGLNDHFALACEETAPTGQIIGPFLRNILANDEAGDLGLEGSEWLAPNVMNYNPVFQLVFG